MVKDKVDLLIEKVQYLINLSKALVEATNELSPDDDYRETARAILSECSLEVDKILAMYGE